MAHHLSPGVEEAEGPELEAMVLSSIEMCADEVSDGRTLEDPGRVIPQGLGILAEEVTSFIA